MPALQLIDTFPTFLQFWQEAQNKTLEAQIDDYSLGHELVKILAKDNTLREIALLKDFEGQFRSLLERLIQAN